MSDPTTPSLAFAFRIEAEIDAPQSAGPSPFGERLHIPITGGQVTGPRLQGTILPGGSDWPVVRPDGSSAIEARYTIRADDGTLIYVVNKGLRVSSADVQQRMRAGETVTPDQFYMRGAPVFDAPAGGHFWLTERLFTCSIAPQGRTIVIDVYSVE